MVLPGFGTALGFAGGVSANVAFVGAGISNASSTSVTLPTHQAGDLILIAAMGIEMGGTLPSLASGYTSLRTSDPDTTSDVWSGRLAYKIAASGSETSGTWTNAGGVMALVYRYASGVGQHGTRSGTVSGANRIYPGLSLNANGKSWVAGFHTVGHASNGATNCPSGWASRGSRNSYSGSATQMGCCDSNGPLASFSNTNVSNGGTYGWFTFTAEILST